VMARKVAIGLGALMVGAAWLLMLAAVVRNSFERYWLPHLWPLKPPVETPSLVRIVAEAVVQPSTASVSWATIGLRLMSLMGVLACVALPVMAFSAGLKHLPKGPIAAALVAGWVLGIVLTHLQAHRTWHLKRPSLGAGPVFGYQVLILLLCGLAVRFL
jgi:hypothetical protein